MTNAAGSDLKRSWERIALRLKTELGDDLYSSWFARMDAETWSDGTLAVSVPTKFLKSWIDGHYQAKLRKASEAELGPVEALTVRVRSRGVAMRESEPRARKPVPPVNGSANGHGPELGSPLDADQTFESFVTGGSNALAHAAAMRVADALPGAALSFNPLFIHAAPGLGKTHLLHGIAWRIRNLAPARRVVLMSAERFMVTFVNAIRQKDTLSFKERFGSVNVLLIDDFQFLQGKATQQEFCHTFNALVDAKRQIVVAADVPPGQLDAIDQRMRSRLMGGLVVDIEPPELSVKRGILNHRLEILRRRGQSVEIGADTADLIAARIGGGGREIEGALNRIAAWLQFNRGAEMTADIAAMVLRDMGANPDACKVKVEDILKVVGKHFNIARAELLSARRAQSVVLPRQVGMFLAKKLTPRSLPEIGRRFGGKDHSTVLHAVRKIDGLMQKDERLARDVAHLVRLLEQY